MGWHLRALNVPTALQYDAVDSLVDYRLCVRSDHGDPDEAELLQSLGVRGADMMPGFFLTNSGIEEDTLARIYLRVIRVHDFVARFTALDEVDGIFDPSAIFFILANTPDELIVDTFNWLWLHRQYRDGSVMSVGEDPEAAERRIADETESIRRRFGYLDEFCAEHPGETDLRIRLTALQERYQPPTNAPVEMLRRKRGYAVSDSFWTPTRLQAALDLGMES